jgi:hypothetical protein
MSRSSRSCHSYPTGEAKLQARAEGANRLLPKPQMLEPGRRPSQPLGQDARPTPRRSSMGHRAYLPTRVICRSGYAAPATAPGRILSYKQEVAGFEPGTAHSLKHPVAAGASEGPAPACPVVSLPELAADGSAREVGPAVDVDVVVLRVADDVEE